MKKQNQKPQNHLVSMSPPPPSLPVPRKTVVPAQPLLRFTPTAWAKLLFLRDLGRTEIGGFAITPAENLVLVQEFVTVKQRVTPASVAFDDDAVADFFDQQIDRGLRPQQFLRIWIHSHPGDSAHPSGTDEETFARVFGRSDWAMMFILSCSGKTYARLRFNAGPGGHLQVPVQVDYSQPFGASDQAAWEAEYRANIHPEPFLSHMFGQDAFEDEWLIESQAGADLDLPWETPDEINQ